MCKYSYLKMCNFSYLHTCIYSYLVQMYEMYLKNQLRMTTFLLRIIPFTGFVPVWMFLMPRGCGVPQAFQASSPFRRSSFILPNYLYFSSSVSVTAACPPQIYGFSRRSANLFVAFFIGALPTFPARNPRRWSCGCWRTRGSRSGGRSL